MDSLCVNRSFKAYGLRDDFCSGVTVSPVFSVSQQSSVEMWSLLGVIRPHLLHSQDWSKVTVAGSGLPVES